MFRSDDKTNEAEFIEHLRNLKLNTMNSTTDQRVLSALHKAQVKESRRKFNMGLFQSFSAVVVAVAVVVGGIGYETHLNHGMRSYTNHVTGVSSSSNKDNASSPNWKSANLLNGQVMSVGKGKLVVKLPPSSHYAKNGKHTDRNIRLTNNTLMWTNGKLVPYSQANVLHQGDFFTAVVKMENGSIIANRIYGPVVQMYGRVVKISKFQVEVKSMYWKLGGNGIKNLVPDGHSVTILFDSHTSGTSISSLNSGQIIQVEGFGSANGKILATDVETINTRK